ncbi:hypothetical protein BASA81_012749 [Batrachochytrium salamandrivorans]|nr:hypothetical protein BASA81_012749 [Batrachochytrium salamandrivorans]
MTAMAFHDRFSHRDITFHSVHPGYVMSNLGNEPDDSSRELLLAFRRATARTGGQGAVTQITAATHPKLAAGGKFLSDHCINTLCNKDCFYCDRDNALA